MKLIPDVDVGAVRQIQTTELTVLPPFPLFASGIAYLRKSDSGKDEDGHKKTSDWSIKSPSNSDSFR
jgi:hypothetical protein